MGNVGSDIDSSTIKPGGIYLITGGNGGLGRIFARYLSQKYGASVIATGRSSVEKSAEQDGVLYLQADVSDREAMTEVIETIKKRYGHLNGLIHAAGIFSAKSVTEKSAAEFEAALKPKIQGTVILDSVTQAEPLDFFVLFSSTSAVIGDFGQCDYAVGNRFLDSFARMRENLRQEGKRQGKTITINWPLWREGGLHGDPESEAFYLQTSGTAYLETKEGLEAFERILNGQQSQVILFSGDPRKIDRWVGNEVRGPRSEVRGVPSDPSPLTSYLIPIEADIRRIAAAILKTPAEELDSDENLGVFGFDSISLTLLAKQLGEQYHTEILPSVFFAHSNIRKIADYLLETLGEKLREMYAEKSLSLPNVGWVKPTVSDNHKDVSEDRQVGFTHPTEPVNFNSEPIAVIGIYGRFPQSESLSEFWNHLESGHDLITQFPQDRWNPEDYDEKDRLYLKQGGFISDIDKFDPLFFNISPPEAELMDPQHRLFIETVWKAVEDAGYSASALSGKSVGVFAATEFNDYRNLLLIRHNHAALMGTGNADAMLSNRISFLMNWHGPSETINTACSGSLVAVHRAVRSLRSGESEMAIAGGVSLMIDPATIITTAQLGVLSPDSRCKTFDQNANGYVKGEGVGVVLLKPLRKAVADHDRIYALIRGTAVYHGGKATSLTAPNSDAQAALLKAAYKDAGIPFDTVTYLELHGTGTKLGDPVEIEGIKKAYNECSEKMTHGRTRSCGLGSVKTNIGHLEPAAGIAGMIKVILSMQNRKLPGTPNFKRLNPYIVLENTPFYVVEKSKDWERLTDAEGNPVPRRAGISSFGFGGAYSHAVLEEYEEEVRGQRSEVRGEDLAPRTSYLISLSAKNEDRLRAYAKSLRDFLCSGTKAELSPAIRAEVLQLLSEILNVSESDIDTDEDFAECGLDTVMLSHLAEKLNSRYGTNLNPVRFHDYPTVGSLIQYLDSCPQDSHFSLLTSHFSLSDMAYTLQIGREQMAERLALVVSDIEELKEKLSLYLDGKKGIEKLYQGNAGKDKAKTGLLLEGEEGKAYLDSIIQKGKLDKLAQLWVSGMDMDWNLIYPLQKRPILIRQVCTPEERQRPNRISVPNYPFARERYWIPDSKSSRNPIKDTSHPLTGSIHPGLCLTRGGAVFQKVFRKAEPVLSDHQVGGDLILPGAACLEMFYAAGKAVLGHGNLRLSRICWHRPLTLTNGKIEAEIVLRQEQHRLICQIQTSNGKGLLIHASGEIISNKSASSEERISIEAIKAGCPKEITGETLYRRFREAGLNYGAYFQGVRHIWANEEESLGSIRIPTGYEKECSVYQIHPALTDAALQTAAGIAFSDKNQRPAVPFSVEEVEILSMPPASGYAYIKTAGQQRFEALVADESGRVCLKLHDVSFRALSDHNIEHFFYKPRWVPTEVIQTETKSAESKRTILLVYPAGSEMLAQGLRYFYPHDEIAEIRLAEENRDISRNLWKIRTDDPFAITRCVGEISRIDAVFFMDIRLENRDMADDLSALAQFQEQGVISLFRLIKALIADNQIRFKPQLRVITDSVYQINPQDRIRPFSGSLSGLTRAFAREYPDLKVSYIDMNLDELSEHPSQEHIRDFLAPVVAEPGEQNLVRETAIRGGRRYVRMVEPVRLPKSEQIPFRQKGVYLILGGAGGIGLEFGKYLARTVAARLILIGRSPLDEKKQKAVEELERLGGSVLYAEADAADIESMRAAVAKGKSLFGNISGAIHSAVVLKDKAIYTMDEQAFRDALAPKVAGSVVLHTVLKDESLDFMIFFSAVQSLFCNSGQSNYAAACTFKDAYALWLGQQKSYPVKIINWGYWGTVGVAADVEHNKRMRSQGILSVEPEEGMDAISRILTCSEAQIIPFKAEDHLLKKLGILPHIAVKSDNDHTNDSFVVDQASLIENRQMSYSRVADIITRCVSDVLGVKPEDIDREGQFSEYGVDSIMGISLIDKVSDAFDISLRTTAIFDYSNVKALSDYICAEYEVRGVRSEVRGKDPEPLTPDPFIEIRGTRSEVRGEIPGPRTPNPEPLSDIAIIGISCRFPGADTADEFWQNLAAGKEAIKEVPKERWNAADYYDPEPGKPGKTYCNKGGFLDNIDAFDPLFFNMSGKEAELSDPRQRIFLEECWKALEDAGYAGDRISGIKCAVFAGVSEGDYQSRLDEAGIEKDAHRFLGNANSVLASRISYILNLTGPAIAIDTACSSSLVTIHLGCQSIRSGESEMVLAGGVFLCTTPTYFIMASNAGMLSPEGRCKTFDNSADGFVPGEGVGVVVLKSLEAAVRDRDYIYGVIKGSGINQDGKTNGMTAPSTRSQTELEVSVYDKSGINPETISYVEAHGTGTKLGDPIEIEALTNAFQKYSDKKGFCAVGSVKSNIGHTAGAAGAASVIKVLLSFRHGQIPPSLNFNRGNEFIRFEDTPFYVNARLEPWKTKAGIPRRAGVSSFGFSGTNAHLILEEWVRGMGSEVRGEYLISRTSHLVPLSAKTEEQLIVYAERLADFLEKQEENISLAQIAYTLQVGRKEMDERLVAVVSTRRELTDKLRSYARSEVGSHTQNLYIGSIESESGEQISESGVIRLIHDQNYEKLAQLWVSGTKIDWNLLYSEVEKPGTVPLPAYPFARERYWIPESETPPRRGGGNGRRHISALHPFIDSNESTLNEQCFKKMLHQEAFYLQDHQVKGDMILPAAVYLEMARASGNLAVPTSEITALSNVIWAAPIRIGEAPKDIYIRVWPDNGGIAYEIVSYTKKEQEVYARGKLVSGDRLQVTGDRLQVAGDRLQVAGDMEQVLDIEAIRNRSTRVIVASDCYEQFRAAGLSYGPAFQTIQELFSNKTEALSRLKLPEHLSDTFHNFVLHPSLIDGAFQTVVGLADDELYLPFAVREVELIRPLTQECYAYAVETDFNGKSEVRKFDIHITDNTGQTSVKIKDFSVRPIRQQPESIDDEDKILQILHRLAGKEVSADAVREMLRIEN